MADNTMFWVRVSSFAFVIVILLVPSHGIENAQQNQQSESAVEESLPSEDISTDSGSFTQSDTEGSDISSSHGDASDERTVSVDDSMKEKVDGDQIVSKSDNNAIESDNDVEAPEGEQSDTKQTADLSEAGELLEDSSNENDSDSTLLMWFKSSFIDPIFEEFSNGLNQKSNDSSNEPHINLTDDQNLNLSSVNTTQINQTEPDFVNKTESETTNSTDISKKQKFECTGRNVTDNTNATVKVITTARLLQLLSSEKNETENVTDCLLVMFYAPWCHFCAKTAPHYNALARAFPQMDFVAVDTAQFSNLLARFGTVSVPTVLVFHQSRAAVRFNQTERTFENLVTFVQNTTGLEPNTTVNVTETDYLGPVPSTPTDDTDYLLIISWIFVIFCSGCMFVKSSRGQQCIRQVRHLWQEHQHID